ncbi:MAG: transposase [Sulfurimonas sp.]|uniref:IS110 family transposase n=1 Tax=Sulfurimonas sp. TaxID=2022749 RepID=UPI00262F77DD|nr:transposase [Sulfurimonas sp.]MDD2651755.1 transposase [Sulfurimonas sp.]MDD3451693.1 transposase [Sulfurimonas sp.]
MTNLIGVDISKDTIDCCLLIQNEPYYHKFNNDIEGFNSLLFLYHNFKVFSLGFESTGNYHKKLEKFLYNNDVKPYILKPLSVSSFRKSLNVHGKTDKTDSYVIARFLRDGDLSEYLSYPTRELFKPILSSLHLMDKQIRQTQNSIHAIELYPETSQILHDLRDIVKYLTITRDRVEKNAISLLYVTCPEAKKIKKDISGVGDKLLIHLIPYLYDHFDKFTLKQINAFFGLNPVSFQSGTSVHKKDKISKKGDRDILRLLYMSAVPAIRSNEILKNKYSRLRDKGKPAKVALVSVMSHILRAIVIKLSHYTKRELKQCKK